MRNLDNLISVIVPVYNVEKYLDQCIDSIVNQTFKNLEIILIDDGSTDASSSICDTWATKDNRIVVIHKENGGVSSARNLGLERATGDFIGFIDSDDYIENDFYEFLMNNLNEYDADISRCIYRYAYDDGHYKASDELNQDVVIFEDNISILNDLHNSGHKSVVLWNKLYKASVINNVRFDESLKVGEDVVFNYYAFKNANRMVCWDIPKYNYRMRESSSRYYDKYNYNAFQSMSKIIEDKDCPTLLYYKCFVFSSMAIHDAIKNDDGDVFQTVRRKLIENKAEIKVSFKILKKSKEYVKFTFITRLPHLYKLLIKHS